MCAVPRKNTASGIRKYAIVVGTPYRSCRSGACGPIAAVGAALCLNVQVNGENVGYVESEQVFENACAVLTRASVCCRPPLRWKTSWGCLPDLLVHRQPDDDRERYRAILRTASDFNGTARR